jgi:predicted Rossmann fold nucleotide-binding protein DprA/Smf involved in DNA uptake
MRKIISGGAYGVDTFAKKFAKEFNISFQAYLPDWNKLGRSAGMVRNRLIVKNSDRVIAFWDGESKGTKNSIALAIKYNKDLNIFIFPKEEELLEYI